MFWFMLRDLKSISDKLPGDCRGGEGSVLSVLVGILVIESN